MAYFEDFDIFVADLEGNVIKQLTTNKGYDAEATLSADGSMIVFTSTRSGDLELWTMTVDGSDMKQITSGLGYDGGAFFSPDGKKLFSVLLVQNQKKTKINTQGFWLKT